MISYNAITSVVIYSYYMT